MTTEEKAKAFEEALERAKKLKETCDNTTVVGWVEYIFQEFAEEEKTRKDLLNFLKSPFIKENICDWKVAPWIAWLEKQGEQKATTLWHDVSEVPDEMQELLVEWESPDATWHSVAFYDAETKTFRHLKKPIENVTRWAYVSDILTQSVTKTSDKVWSEEDEDNLRFSERHFKTFLTNTYYDTFRNWLKSLKERLKGE